jgi:hypothetical protein
MVKITMAVGVVATKSGTVTAMFFPVAVLRNIVFNGFG